MTTLEELNEQLLNISGGYEHVAGDSALLQHTIRFLCGKLDEQAKQIAVLKERLDAPKGAFSPLF